MEVGADMEDYLSSKKMNGEIHFRQGKADALSSDTLPHNSPCYQFGAGSCQQKTRKNTASRVWSLPPARRGSFTRGPVARWSSGSGTDIIANNLGLPCHPWQDGHSKFAMDVW